MKVFGVQKNLLVHIQNKPSIYATSKSSISRNSKKKVLEIFLLIDHANFITLVIIPKTYQYNQCLHNSSSAVTIINILGFFRLIFINFTYPASSPSLCSFCSPLPSALHPHLFLRKDKTTHGDSTKSGTPS